MTCHAFRDDGYKGFSAKLWEHGRCQATGIQSWKLGKCIPKVTNPSGYNLKLVIPDDKT
jgi:hypothetical protein